MKVLMNLLCLQAGRNGGVATYCFGLLGPLSRLPGLHLTLLCTPELADEIRPLADCKVLTPGMSFPNRLTRVIYEQTWLSHFAKRSGAELLFCPGYLSPIVPTMPTVVTIHDTQFRDIPKMISLSQRAIYNLIIPTASRRASGIITVSSFSRNQIIKHLHVAPDRVHVTHEASHPTRLIHPWAGCALPEHFILCVAGSSSHKNIQRLCRAYASARSAFANPWPLVLVGRVPEALSQHTSAMMTNIQCLGYVSDAALVSLYHSASAFIFPSLYEGFGLPVLEAMGAGLPVACSNATCLPEVAGDAALLFDPLSESSIAAALIRLVNEPELRDHLVCKGRCNVSRFSWENCADQTAKIFRTILALDTPEAV